MKATHPDDRAMVVDTHNDILTQATEKGLAFDTDLTGKTHSDLARWKKGGNFHHLRNSLKTGVADV